MLEDLGFRPHEMVGMQLHPLLKACAYDDERMLTDFRKVFRESQRVSIDSFLGGLPKTQMNDMFVKIGRDAIATVMHLCEAHSQLDGDWYQWLLEFLLRNGRDFPAGLISVVTFNYDRSLEQYLWRAFMRSFDLSSSEAREMLERIEFIHVYGDLGPLMMDGANPNAVQFGDLNSVFTSGQRLTVAGLRADSSKQERIRKVIADAKRVIFLGFGFWKENLDLVFTPPPKKYENPNEIPPSDWSNKRIFASCYRLWRSVMIDTDARVTTNRFSNAFSPLINWGTEDQNLLQFVTHWNLKG